MYILIHLLDYPKATMMSFCFGIYSTGDVRQNPQTVINIIFFINLFSLRRQWRGRSVQRGILRRERVQPILGLLRQRLRLRPGGHRLKIAPDAMRTKT